jgi:tetratricopeptide (TPR) repeat protein
MIDDYSLTELFDRYLEEELKPSEKVAFDSLLATNPVVAEKFHLFQEIDKALLQEDIMHLRKQIKSIQANNYDLLEAGPMQIAGMPESMEVKTGTDRDINDLRDKLNRIHEAILNNESDTGMDSTLDEHFQTVPDAIDEITEYGIYQEMRNDLAGTDGVPTQLDRDIGKAIMQEDVISLRNKLDLINKRVITTKTAKPVIRKYLVYASSAAAVLIAGTLILNLNNKAGDSKAYAGLFQPYEAVSVTRGPAGNEDKIRNTAIELYNQGDFLQAGNLLDAIIENGETSKLLRVYAGACALQNGDPDKGIKYLANWDETEPTFIDAQWYLAGCYLNKNEWEKALGILEKLVNNDYFKNYPYPAEKLIRKLHRQH